MQNHGLQDVPAREIYYFSDANKRVGMIMLYCDPPSYNFWAPYCDSVNDPENSKIRETLFA